MAPESLELLLFLYCNSDLWDYPVNIDEAMAWEKEQPDAEAAAAEVEGNDEEEENEGDSSNDFEHGRITLSLSIDLGCPIARGRAQ